MKKNLTVYGHSVTSVIRKLGKEGFSFPLTRAALQSQNVKPSDNTIRIFLSAGRTGQRGTPAKINRNQVRDLRKAGKTVLAAVASS